MNRYQLYYAFGHIPQVRFLFALGNFMNAIRVSNMGLMFVSSIIASLGEHNETIASISICRKIKFQYANTTPLILIDAAMSWE